MLKGSDRRARTAFKRALEIKPQNYTSEAIDHISSELEQLNEEFKRLRLPLLIRGTWIEKDLSFVSVMELTPSWGDMTPLLKLQITPLSIKKAQVIASYEAILEDNESATENSKKLKVKQYTRMDKDDCLHRLLSDVRKHIMATIPMNLIDDVEAVFVGLSVGESDFKDHKALMQCIPGKYSGTHDPHQAYLASLYCQ